LGSGDIIPFLAWRDISVYTIVTITMTPPPTNDVSS
jgi:hypothetical protein